MSNFVINKGMSNEFIITIKQNSSTLPMTITNTDTFVAKLYKLADNSLVNTTTATIESAPNGKIKLSYPSEITSALVSSRGDRADNYYLRPTYRLAIDCVTTNNGTFVAKLGKVYVE